MKIQTAADRNSPPADRSNPGSLVNRSQASASETGSGRNVSVSRPIIHSLPYRELKRRFWHMAPGVLAFGLLFVSHADPISPTLTLLLVACCVILGLRILLGFRQIQRQGEGRGTSAVAGYALSVLLTILFFPRHLELGLGVLGILAFGDGSATLAGMTLRGPRLPWNPAKSWSGVLAFWAVGTILTSILYWGETLNAEAADPPVTLPQAVLICMPAVICAAIAESVRSSVNDNVRVGVTAAASLITMHFLVRSF